MTDMAAEKAARIASLDMKVLAGMLLSNLFRRLATLCAVADILPIKGPEL
jgi:hypothetical protein